MSPFLLPPKADRYILRNATWLAASGADLVRGDIVVADGRVEAMGSVARDDTPAIDARDGLALPCFVDVHTHLDKGHIWPRSPNPDGTFLGALTNVAADREASWSADDVRARMNFGLRSAHAQGTAAIRTHLDSLGPQTAITWPVFAELRQEWRGRIDLQGAALFPIDLVLNDPRQFRAIVETVARHGGSLGAVTYLGVKPDERTDAALDELFAAAMADGLDLDLHVDESGSPEALTLERIADAALRHRFKGRILCGHCCSLSLLDDAERDRVVGKLAEARIAVVSLPLCNMYLQDRAGGRTPRWRGVAPVHELAAAGVTVMVASDNTRDPFYAYGDLDMLEVWREATRILHLDHPFGEAARMVAATPAEIMGLSERGHLRAGAPADFIMLPARNLNELFSRPWRERLVVRGGRAIDTTLPDYRELDETLMRNAVKRP